MANLWYLCPIQVGLANTKYSNLVVLGDLGRMPIIIHCLQKQFLFSHGLINLTGYNLVKGSLSRI